MSTGAEWNDWLLPPRVASTAEFDVLTVNTDTYPIALPAAELDGAFIKLLYGGGGGGAIQVDLLYCTWDGVAPVTVYHFLTVSIEDTQSVVIPLSSLGPTLVLYMRSVPVPNSTLVVSYVTRSASTETVMLTGFSPSIAITNNVNATSVALNRLNPTVPGKLALYFTTTAAVWHLDLEFLSAGTFFAYIIGSNTAPITPGQVITTPASSSRLRFYNSDVTTQSYSLSAIYQP